MKKLSAEEMGKKIVKLDKFERFFKDYYFIYIDGTGFTYDVSLGCWFKLSEPYVYTYPISYDFFRKIRNEIGHYEFQKASSIEEVLEEVSDDIRDTILFNLNLFR